MEVKDASGSQRILIWTPFGKDAAHLSKVLTLEGFECRICVSADDILSGLSDVGVIITTQEALGEPQSAKFIAALQKQPSWSALPLIVFYSGSTTIDPVHLGARHPLQQFADITFLQRPISSSTLIDASRAALRDRRRQYQIKYLMTLLSLDLEQKERHEGELKIAKEASDRDRLAALAASSSKSQFLANMSHEIRTPLGAIMGFLSLLKNPSNTREDVEEFISVIDRNSVQLLRLIDDILDLSKVEAGKLEIENVEFSLVDVIADCAALMGFKAREKGIIFKVILETDVPLRVVSDPTRLRQIIVNIVGNAIKFTERGQVEMRVSYVDRIVKITVVDSGRGISAEQQQRLFQAFSQADNSTTRLFGGTGLGLVLTRYLSEAMGGHFVLEKSSLGEGSTFVATLKVSTPANIALVNKSDFMPAKRKPAETKPKLLADKKILLVEDSPDNQSLFTIWLNHAGATVDLASDGQEGLERALAANYDVVLMDIQMPIRDGHSATRELRKQGYKGPVIALTAHAMKEEQDKTVESGFSGFLTKPVERNVLVEAINSVSKSEF